MQPSALVGGAPTGTRLVVGVHCILTIASMALPSVASFGLSVSGMQDGRLWSLPLFWLVARLGASSGIELLFAAVSAMAALSYFPRLEQEHGTFRFLIWFMLSSSAVGVLYLFLAFGMAQLDPTWYMVPCSGLWPMFVIAMTSQSLGMPPDASTSLFGLVPLPMRWYPLALIAFFSLISMRLELDLLAAWLIALGIHHSSGGSPLHRLVAKWRCPLGRLLPSLATVSAMEDSSSSYGNAGQVLGGGSSSFSLRSSLARAARGLGRCCPASLRKHYISASSVGFGVGGQYAAVGGSAWGGHGGSARVRTVGGGGPAASTLGSGSGPSFVAFTGSGQRLGEV